MADETMDWHSAMPASDRTKVREHILTRLTAHYTALTAGDLARRVGEYEAEMYAACATRTNYIRHTMGGVHRADRQHSEREAPRAPLLTPCTGDDALWCHDVPHEAPPAARPERLAAVRHVRAQLATAYVPDDQLTAAAVNVEEEAYAACATRDDYVRALAAAVAKQLLIAELEEVLNVPPASML